MDDILKDKRVLLGVTGGIAAYKAIELASRLTKAGALVDVVLSENALNFVTPLSFNSITGRHVYIDAFDNYNNKISHIDLAGADFAIIAPATKNFIAKLRAGIADDLLLDAISACINPVFIAPAMNSNMYLNETNMENIAYLKSKGYNIIEPASGVLACKTTGIGRLPEPVEIIKLVQDKLSKECDFAGKKIIVTAGPTISKLDPVRIFTNRSSGKMGEAIASVLKSRGADVIYISHIIPKEDYYRYIRVDTTKDMLEAVKDNLGADILFMNAAPLDYEFSSYNEEKIKKADELELKMTRTPDILKSIKEIKGDLKVFGFAAESENLIENAKKKIADKDMDFIFVNNIKGEDGTFGSDYNSGILIDKNGFQMEIARASKREIAKTLIDYVKEAL
ncbi:MAG: bifunctional phosphopantothenoylcysteine decarboxylase/phosphopantothenate--cysteine ligase CoaBC [Firmicutes bacterium]|nr:bifunctional phosphopantothenoylcysteine decarboxylase/phosphopantothenate--cysteine ligase CoaBC [Bacillota bacterium]